MQLVACAHCLRHVQAGASRCPFCSAAMSARGANVGLVTGRLSRAAVFAASAACSSGTTQLPREERSAISTPAPTDAAVADVAAAKLATGTVRGSVFYVKNAQRVPLAHKTVIVKVDDPIGGREWATRTNEQGTYELALPTGDYRVDVSPHGKHDATFSKRVTVIADAVATADVEVHWRVIELGPCCKPYGAPPARRRVV